MLKNKKVVVIGGNGGLGRAYVERLQKEGAEVYIGARNLERIDQTFSGCKDYIDVNYYQSVEKFVDNLKNKVNSVDYVIDATGYDVRKSLENHTEEEINNSLAVNLRGAIYLSKAFLKILKEEEGNTIVFMGGFVDGSIGFPYYSVDVATRAGLFSFIEAMNRELKQEGRKVRLTYFCPDPADTDAERPYHPIWKEMKTPIRTTDEVAQALLTAILKKKNIYYMGGHIQSFFAKLNHISSKLSDLVLMDTYSKILKKYLN